MAIAGTDLLELSNTICGCGCIMYIYIYIYRYIYIYIYPAGGKTALAVVGFFNLNVAGVVAP